MVRLSQIFTGITGPQDQMLTNDTVVHRSMPMLNTISNTLHNFFGQYGQVRKKKYLMQWYRGIPELTAFINKIAVNTVSNYQFVPVKPNQTSRNKIMTANKFAQSVVLKQTMEEQMVDMLVAGEGFGWLGFLKEDTVKKEIDLLVKKYQHLELKEKVRLSKKIYTEIKQEEGFANIDGVDEDILRPRRYRSIASETMEVVHNQFDILFYRQIVGAKIINFDAKEIVRYTLMKRRGKVEGFSSVESIVTQLELLRQMWQNMLALYKNGGYPDKIFNLENVNPNSQAFKRIEQQIQKYKRAENKHGNMLWTGKLTVHELQQLDTMQFKDMGLYITGLVAMQWGIPRSSIPYIIGGTNTKDDSGGNSERSYWDVVANFQKKFEDTMNTQLWIPHFGVKIKFDNPFKQLDIQRETALMSKLNNIMSVEQILNTSGKQMKLDKKLKLLDMNSEDIEDLEVRTDGSAEGIGTDAQISPTEVNRSDGDRNVSRARRREQSQSRMSIGEPTGR